MRAGEECLALNYQLRHEAEDLQQASDMGVVRCERRRIACVKKRCLRSRAALLPMSRTCSCATCKWHKRTHCLLAARNRSLHTCGLLWGACPQLLSLNADTTQIYKLANMGSAKPVQTMARLLLLGSASHTRMARRRHEALPDFPRTHLVDLSASHHAWMTTTSLRSCVPDPYFNNGSLAGAVLP